MRYFMRGMSRLLLMVMVVVAVVPSSGMASAPERLPVPVRDEAKPAIAPLNLPAPPAGGPRPTIALAPDHGYRGQPFVVSGQGVAPYPGVRIAWLSGDATLTATVVDLEPSGSYAATLAVPEDLWPGQVQVCVAVTGAELAEFACADFMVDSAPPGAVEGQLPASLFDGLDAAGLEDFDADFALDNKWGTRVASTPILADRTFRINEVAAGDYRAAVVGRLPFPVHSLDVTILPDGETHLEIQQLPPLSICEFVPPDVAVVSLTASPSGLETPVSFFGSERGRFGIYVRDADLNVVFEAGVGGKLTLLQQVDFRVCDGTTHDCRRLGAGHEVQTGRWQYILNVGDLAENDPYIKAVPVLSGAGCVQSYMGDIVLLDNPMAKFGVDGSLAWRPGYDDYAFSGALYPAGLPATKDHPVPIIGTLHDSLNGTLTFQGHLKLNGDVSLKLSSWVAAELFSINVLNRTDTLIDDQGSEKWFDAPYSPQSLAVHFLRGGANWPYDFSVETTLWQANYGIPYIADVRFKIRVGIGGKVEFWGDYYPWTSQLDANLGPAVEAWLALSVKVTLLLFAKGGADLTTGLGVSMPLEVKMNFPDSGAHPKDPCFYAYLHAKVWGKLFGKKKTYWQGDIVNYDDPDGCRASAVLASATELEEPRAMASPALASGAGGRVLSLVVEDVTPWAETPTLQVMARFRDPASHTWGAAMAVSDDRYTVNDPTGAFVGAAGYALAAWTQTMLPPDSEESDALEIMRHQEIFYAAWDGVQWSTPQRLTNNSLPDGMPVMAADSSGISLAWVRDTDGDASTRQDWKIALTHWNPSTSTWGTVRLLSYQTGVMNAQVSLARHSGRIGLAWTVDEDGDLTTNSDRYIVLAQCTLTTCTIVRPDDFPARADSPSGALTANGGALAFLVRPNGAGLGNDAVVWVAYYVQSGSNFSWEARPVTDWNGAVVRGDEPVVSRSGTTGELLVAFRRFGEPGTTRSLGQVALTRINPGRAASAPVYLTSGDDQRWQIAMAIDTATNEAIVMDVQREAWPGKAMGSGSPLVLASPPAAAQPAATTTILTESDDPVVILAVPSGPDPALDPALVLSQQHAPAGTGVDVTATVRNVGRQTASNLAVALYAGTPETGTLLAATQLPGGLDFNASEDVTFPVTAGSGHQPLTAQVTSGGADVNPANNRATADLGALPAPAMVDVTASYRYADALEITWTPAVTDVSYRILRAEVAGGPYELVGEAEGTSFDDVLLPNRCQGYRYVVQAADGVGVRSVYSAEASGALPGFDFNGSGTVDILDVVAVADRWSLTATDPDPDHDSETANYERPCDVNLDGAIDVQDILRVAGRWGDPC